MKIRRRRRRFKSLPAAISTVLLLMQAGTPFDIFPTNLV
jgi:hypothetical protein